MRRGSESNRRPRLCRPLHNHSATPPPTLARLHPTSAPRRTANQGWRGPPRANGVGCRAAGTCTASRATKLKTGDRSYRLDLPGNLERETRLELATPTLARLCSTTELFPQSSLSAANSAPIPKYPTECNKWATGVSTYVGLGSPCRRYLAASSGGTGLMKNPVPHSNPATLVSRGLISRCQWK